MHLLIPFASSTDPSCRVALRDLRLPHLEQVLARWRIAERDDGAQESLTPPHERVLARTCAMLAPDGCVPGAAQQAHRMGLDAQREGAWAWISPAHWNVATGHVNMRDPAELALGEAESQALMAAIQPYFTEDGITLHRGEAPTRWLARAEIFRNLPTASLDRVAGQDIVPWMPVSALLRRLQNEMQMLLYTHPVNETRVQAGHLPVNSFWVSGTGALPTDARTDAATPTLRIDNQLRAPAVTGDWQAWREAWQALDARHGSGWIADAQQRLTLCGTRNAVTLAPQPRGWLARLRQSGRRTVLHDFADAL